MNRQLTLNPATAKTDSRRITVANSAIFNAYREFQAPYTRGLKPFSAEFKAAQRLASRDWHNGGKVGRDMDSRENPSQGGGGILLLAAVVGGGYLLWKKNQTDKAKVALAAAALANRPANPSYIGV
jgi:hypothetical protein